MKKIRNAAMKTVGPALSTRGPVMKATHFFVIIATATNNNNIAQLPLKPHEQTCLLRALNPPGAPYSQITYAWLDLL